MDFLEEKIETSTSPKELKTSTKKKKENVTNLLNKMQSWTKKKPSASSHDGYETKDIRDPLVHIMQK